MEWVVLWLLSIIITTYIGAKKGNAVAAFFVGLFFGPLGIIFAALSGDKHRHPCPYCRELVKDGASICPHCRKELGQQPAQ